MTENICPYLGSTGDPLSCTTCATEDNCCYATGDDEPVATLHQKKYCLGGKLTSCPHFPAESTLPTSSGQSSQTIETADAPRTGASRSSSGDGSRRFDASLYADEYEDEADGKLGGEAVEDEYFDALEPIGNGEAACPDDFYFDADGGPEHSERTGVSGATVSMDLRDVTAGQRPSFGPAVPPPPAPATPPSPTPAAFTSPTVAAPASPQTPIGARPVTGGEQPPSMLFDPTQQLSPVPPAPPIHAPSQANMPEPARPRRNDSRPERIGRRERAGVDPAWMARQLAEQAQKNGPPPSMPEPPLPPRTVPEPVARVTPPPVPAPIPVTTVPVPDRPESLRPAPPEHLMPEPRPRRSRTFLYLSISSGVFALLLVCAGGLALRTSLLAGGPATDVVASNNDVQTATPATMLTDTPSRGALVQAPATEAPATEVSTTEPLATEVPFTEAPTDRPTQALPTGSATSPSVPEAVATIAQPPMLIPTPELGETASPTPAQTDTATPSATETPPPTASPTATASDTIEPTVPPTATPAPTNTASPARTHAISAGDTPYDVATQYGVTLDALLRANPGLDPQRLRIGQVVKIPGQGSETEVALLPNEMATLNPADTPMATLTDTATPEPTPTSTPTPELTSAPTAADTTVTPGVHLVAAGDTLLAIAVKYDVDLDALVAANPGLRPETLSIGQEIVIPGGAPLSPTAPAEPVVAPAVPAVHEIQSGESLAIVAARYGLTLEQIESANPGVDSRRLRVGQQIKLPGEGGGGPASEPSSPPPVVTQGQAPTRITAASISLDAEVASIPVRTETQGGVELQVWDDPAFAAGFHTTGALPGQPGNIVISGLSKGQGEVFRTLGDIKEGAEVQLLAGDQSYRYAVERVLMLPAKYVSADKRRANENWLAPTDDARLTIVSAWPYETGTHRLIVIARPVQ